LGDFQNRNLGPNLYNQVNPIYLFPVGEFSPTGEMSPLDQNGAVGVPYEYLDYSDSEEFFRAPVPAQPVLADYVAEFLGL